VHRLRTRRRAGGDRAAGTRGRARGHARLRTALPALDRPVPQRRAQQRPLPPGRRRHGPGAAHPGAELRLRAADPRAGRRRLRVVEGPRPPRREDPDLMQLGMIGLGRMGNNMTARLEQHGHDVKTYDPGVPSTADSLAELRDQLDKPRVFWKMVPAGKITEESFHMLLTLVDADDTIVDGGNSNFHDSQRRYAEAREYGVNFIDAGVSGGIWGLRNGYCLMVGGDKEPVQRLEPIFKALAPEDGYA